LIVLPRREIAQANCEVCLWVCAMYFSVKCLAELRAPVNPMYEVNPAKINEYTRRERDVLAACAALFIPLHTDHIWPMVVGSRLLCALVSCLCERAISALDYLRTGECNPI